MPTQNLVPCPDCEHTCSVNAQSCPQCGSVFAPSASHSSTILADAVHTQVVGQSASKVGLCLSLFGLIRVAEGVKGKSATVDELLALAALGFIIAGLLAYVALKETGSTRKARYGTLGHWFYIVSTGALGLICIFVLLEFT
jgi:hypothetical protein